MSRPQKPTSFSAGLFSEPAAGRAALGVAIANIDGGARGNPGPAAYGMVLRDAGGATLVAAGKSIGRATNNVAEYYGLIAALDAARERGVRRLRVESDSELLVRQIQGHYRVKSPGLKPLHERALKLSRAFEHFEIAHVPREKNREADRLVNVALDGEDGEHRERPSPGQAGQPEQGVARAIRARYRRGVLVPEESLDIPDGAEVTLTIKFTPPHRQ